MKIVVNFFLLQEKMTISGTIDYVPVIGKTVGSRSYSDGTASKVIHTEVAFEGTGITWFALGGEGSHSLGRPSTTPEIVSGFAKDSRVRLRGLKFRWMRTEGEHSGDIPFRCNVTVYVGVAENYISPVQYIWYFQDPMVTSCHHIVEHVYGDLDEIVIPAGSNIFVRMDGEIDVGPSGTDETTLVGEMSCDMVIDD